MTSASESIELTLFTRRTNSSLSGHVAATYWVAACYSVACGPMPVS